MVPLEGRALLSAGVAPHPAGDRPVPVVAAQVHVLGIHAPLNHKGHGGRTVMVTNSGVGRAQFLGRPVSLSARANLARLAGNGGGRGLNLAPRVIGLVPGGDPPSDSFNTHLGSALPNTNPGGGTRLSGDVNGFDNGSAIPGANPGSGTTPSGSLLAPDMGTSLPGTNPGGGATPSGTI